MPPVPPFPPDAVVFDLDGLLVDSEHAWARADRRVVEALGGRWEDDLHRRLVGRGPHEAACEVAAHLGNRHAPEEITERVLSAVQAELAHGLQARSGAVALVGELHGRVPLAVATNSPRVLAEHALTLTGLSGCFEVVVCVEDVRLPKPAPDAYLKACVACGADPRRSIALEDSPSGTRAARTAGLWVIGCPSLPDVALPSAHALVTSLSGVEAAVLLQGPVAIPAGPPAQDSRARGSRGSLDRPT